MLRLLWGDGTLCVLGDPLVAEPLLLEFGYGRKKLTLSAPAASRRTHSCFSSAQTASAVNNLRHPFVLDMSDLDQAPVIT